MTGLQLLALADDLTGAMEVGAQFASRGIASTVTVELDLQPRELTETSQVLVIDTETRHLPASEAGRRVHSLASEARERAIRYIFKKTDSTLRGNIGSEIGAVMDAFPGTPLIYAPAYPCVGRTVRMGILYVDGIPVSETAFGADSLNPVRESDISYLIQKQRPDLQVIVTQPGEVCRATAPVVYVVDGEAEDDLRAAAVGFAGGDSLRLAAGPAGIAGHLADRLALERSHPSPLPSIRTCLVVNGSLHEASRMQIDHALSSGWTLSTPDRLASDLAASRWVLARASDFSMLGGEPLAAIVGRIVAGLAGQTGPDALIVFGGDTAFGVQRALGSPILRPLGEVLPGIAVAVIDAGAICTKIDRKGRALILMTKAGGFGPPDALAQVRARLDRT